MKLSRKFVNDYTNSSIGDTFDNDGLINYIRENDELSKNKFNRRDMFNIAKSILDKHIDEFICYDIIYKDYVDNDERLNWND